MHAERLLVVYSQRLDMFSKDDNIFSHYYPKREYGLFVNDMRIIVSFLDLKITWYKVYLEEELYEDQNLSSKKVEVVSFSTGASKIRDTCHIPAHCLGSCEDDLVHL